MELYSSGGSELPKLGITEFTAKAAKRNLVHEHVMAIAAELSTRAGFDYCQLFLKTPSILALMFYCGGVIFFYGQSRCFIDVKRTT